MSSSFPTRLAPAPVPGGKWIFSVQDSFSGLIDCKFCSGTPPLGMEPATRAQSARTTAVPLRVPAHRGKLIVSKMHFKDEKLLGLVIGGFQIWRVLSLHPLDLWEHDIPELQLHPEPKFSDRARRRISRHVHRQQVQRW